METFLILICLAEVDVNQDSVAFVIDNDIGAFQDTFGIKIVVLWNNIRLPEQAIKGHKEGAPQREILGFVEFDVAVHSPQDNRIDWKDKLRCSLQSSLNTL